MEQYHRRRNRGGTGGTCPQEFAINKEVPFLYVGNAPFLKEKGVLKVSCHPKFEMLPTSLSNVQVEKEVLDSLLFRSSYILKKRLGSSVPVGKLEKAKNAR